MVRQRNVHRQQRHQGILLARRKREAFQAGPNDFQARFDLALGLNGAGKRDEAVDQLVAIARADRNWNEDAARKQLLQFFEAWGLMDPAAIRGRRQLSTLLFS